MSSAYFFWDGLAQASQYHALFMSSFSIWLRKDVHGESSQNPEVRPFKSACPTWPSPHSYFTQLDYSQLLRCEILCEITSAITHLRPRSFSMLPWPWKVPPPSHLLHRLHLLVVYISHWTLCSMRAESYHVEGFVLRIYHKVWHRFSHWLK